MHLACHDFMTAKAHDTVGTLAPEWADMTAVLALHIVFTYNIM